jgi:hypothetical protein
MTMDPLLLPEPEPTPGDLARPLNAVELALAAWLDAKFNAAGVRRPGGATPTA